MPMMRTRNHPGPGELLPPAYYYGVWQINLTRETGVAMPVTFICVLDENDVLVRVTHLQDYIADGDNLTAPYEAYNKKRCLLFAKMLNYILVERRDDYGIDSILDIEKVMMQDFFTDYASMNLPGDHTRAPETSWECVRICTFTMKQLVVQYGSEMKITVQELVKTKTFRDFKGVLVTKEVPNFTAHDMSNDPAREAIFRELPTKAFELLIPLAFRFTPDIAFGLCLGAFAGLRPGEICNVRQECSPWGAGIRFSVDTNGDPIPEIDLRREYALRSDKVSV
ncbi:MAG: hypothetical protein IJS84_05635, partial [Spirochaetales bacterium]|nr:hypothetical protein [Spirochaetales bacterium]